jgi:nucleotide-binding universal stress UspA family protein
MFNSRVVLVPVDFSRLSQAALEPAIQVISHSHGTLHLLHVIDDVELLATSVDTAVSARLYEEMMHEAKLQFARLLSRVRAVHHHFAIRSGRPADVILRYAEEIKADLIVMATHGRHGMARAFLGSTTEQVVRQAACPVLSIRPAEVAAEASTTSK